MKIIKDHYELSLEKAECIWTCKKKVFKDYLKAIKMYDSLQDERFK